MNADKSHIVIVLDRSGSMQSLAGEVLSSINNFVDEQRKLAGQASVTLRLFDDKHEVVWSNQDLRDVPTLHRFEPRGMTALYDAMGFAIEDTGKYLAALPEEERPGRVSVVILTDGQENMGRKFTREQIREMVELQTTKYAWQFLYLGANQDAVLEGGKVGVASASTYTYQATTLGFGIAVRAASKTVGAYRSTGSTGDLTQAAEDSSDNGK